MTIDTLAAITFTIRDHIKTEKDFALSMEKLAAIGYRAVQVSGVPHDTVSPEFIRKVCSDNGLTVCATHEPAKMILEEPDKVVERLQRIGCQHTAFPYPAGVDLRVTEEREALIQGLENSGQVLHKAGLTLSYHNHAAELLRVGQTTVLDLIFKGTAPEALQAEIDVYWIQIGGGNPVEWCEALPNRLPLLHLKDAGVYQFNEPTMTEIGSGNLNFKAVVAAARAAGCQWYIVEQDRCPGDPFESLKISFDYIKENLI